MSDDIKELVKRLRVNMHAYGIAQEAADALEALVAERDRLKAALEGKQADPAPVCGWRLDMLPEPDGGSHYATACGDVWTSWYNTPREDNYSYCPSCGKPIKFTEAKE